MQSQLTTFLNVVSVNRMQCLTTVTDYIKQENTGEVGLANERRHYLSSHMKEASLSLCMHTDIELK